MHAKLLARQRLHRRRYSQDSACDSVVCMIRGAGMDATTMQRMGGDSGDGGIAPIGVIPAVIIRYSVHDNAHDNSNACIFCRRS